MLSGIEKTKTNENLTQKTNLANKYFIDYNVHKEKKKEEIKSNDKKKKYNWRKDIQYKLFPNFIHGLSENFGRFVHLFQFAKQSVDKCPEDFKPSTDK